MAEVTADFPRPEYPNSPLQGVVFEIRFPGEPAIECHRDDFFAIARAEYPHVFVPKLKPGAAAALSPYRFQRGDDSGSLLTALNLFAYQTSVYPGFPRFSYDVLRWIRAFGELYKIGPLTRTGLRYTNIIPYAPSDAFPVTNFFDVSITLGAVKSSCFSRFSLSASIPSEAGALTVQIDEIETSDSEQPAILLDFDFAISSPDLHIDHIEQYLEASHAETKRLFEGLLSDRYRAFMRGEGFQ